MRLLNLWTGAFEQFTDIKKVKYAILSHTWTDHEVTFEDFQRHPEEARQSPKIHWFCVTAFNLGYKYVWIDTCCIDKSSSAELSEAINSMFYWYQESGLCCVYLSDVPDIDDPVEQELAVRKSRWFTRGWTLQELLAPESVRFYNASWRAIGERNSPFSIGPPPSNQLPSWTKLISEITKIRDHCLKGRAVYLTASVAERMSWAAGRRTTRIEDRAYSLLGLFQINMALLYGEGANAFRRLQQEIINNTEDQTIFAWGYGLGSHSRSDSTCFCLADTPEDFQYGGQIRSDLHATDTHYSMTNRGLHVDLALTQLPQYENIFMARLSCDARNSSRRKTALALPLLKFSDQSYFRHEHSSPVVLPSSVFDQQSKERIYIVKSPPYREEESRRLSVSIMFDAEIIEVYPPTWACVFDMHRSTSKFEFPNGTADDHAGRTTILARIRSSRCSQDKLDFVLRIDYKFYFADDDNVDAITPRYQYGKLGWQLVSMPRGFESIAEILFHDANRSGSPLLVGEEKLEQASDVVSAKLEPPEWTDTVYDVVKEGILYILKEPVTSLSQK